ncbi:MAG: AraC family transcriptional regulator [Gammaproteobacteria bacterium]|jgi:AraC-like DNA-binding protein
MGNTLLASASRILWRTIRSHGIDPNKLFAEAGLDPAKINEPAARFPVDNARKAWSLALDAIGDPCFGIAAGHSWLSTDLHALGYAFLSSTTLMTAINRVARYNEVVDEVITFNGAVEGDYLVVSYQNAREDLPDIAPLEDARWSTLLSMCRAAKAGAVYPAMVQLMHGELPCLQAYRHYFGCEPEFDQPRSALWFELEKVNEPLPAVNKELAKINEHALLDYLDQLHKEDLTRKVERAIAELLVDGEISDGKVAESLFISTRTLQRRLAEDGLTYKQLLENVRRTLAEEYIRDERLSLNEISYLLGFSEQSSFSRAFKRWTGTSPSEARS